MPTISPIESVGRPLPSESVERNRPLQEDRAASEQQPSPETIRKALESNPRVVLANRTVEFAYNEDIDRVVVTVKSGDTDEIVRQIPTADYLKFVSQFREFLGVIFDEVA